MAADTHAPWQREFKKNIDVFQDCGLSKKEANKLLQEYLRLSSTTPVPGVMKTFDDPNALEEVGVYTERINEIRDFMIEFLRPLLSRFKIEGLENIKQIAPLLGKFPITLVSNHLSHFDTAAMYLLLYEAGGKARDLANSMVFIAGRLVFLTGFTRPALHMINSLLVCSKRDMADNPNQADLMTRINMRSFRHAQSLQKEGKVVAVFPEGTRSRTGRLITFVDAVYHYVANKIIVPVSLTGTDQILPTGSFLFNAAQGKMTLGKPILVGNLPGKQMEKLPGSVERLKIPEGANKKTFIIDSLALFVGRNLHKHRHGTYRNLYVSEGLTKGKNKLIEAPKNAVENIVVIGHSRYGVAIAAILANKKVSIKVYLHDEEKVKKFNELCIDEDNYPLYKLPPNIRFTSDSEDIKDGTLFIQAVRAWEIEDYYKPIKKILQETSGPMINVVKGFTNSKYGLILDDLEHIYDVDPGRLAALAGANYPEQILERKFSGFELAAANTSLVNHLLELFHAGYISCRPANNPYDVRGVQLGGALKNIYALGVGLIDGYYEKHLGGNSDNSLFHISSHIFEEMTKVGVALGGKESTFRGLSGYTDLMLSCFGQDSRDRQYGHDFMYGEEDPLRKSPGLFGVNIIPKLIKLKPNDYPLLAGIYSVIVRKEDKDRVLARIIDGFEKSVMLI